MTAMLLLSSKGMAGVPRGPLVVLAAVVPACGIPAAGIAVLLVIDQLLDMGRTATNILGNAIATAVLGQSHDKAAREAAQTDESAHDADVAKLTSVR
jgi:Na+/H+-dicarboxylate symporter